MDQIAARGIRNGYTWSVGLMLRALLAVCALVSMVLASGAGSHWN